MGQFYLVDAFITGAGVERTDAERTGADGTDPNLARFSGNPAGVCLLGSDRPESWLQAMAAEINQAETAFLSPCDDGSWNLRWFTPVAEVSLCGHATLAAAHVLWTRPETRRQTPGEQGVELRFHTLSGELRALQTEAGIQLDFPADNLQAAADQTQALAAALGVAPQWVGRGRDHLLAVLESAQQVQNLKPNCARLVELDARGIIVTALGTTTDMISRFFAPALGIAEDSVTGAAHCLLAVYWGERLGRNQLSAYQASTRGGHLDLLWQGDRVLLSGRAQTRIQGVYCE